MSAKVVDRGEEGEQADQADSIQDREDPRGGLLNRDRVANCQSGSAELPLSNRSLD
jgi:hypothetical protein